MDFIVNNQWIGDMRGFDWWTSTFKNSIGEIGYVLTFFR
jgi:hypothetical protein